MRFSRKQNTIGIFHPIDRLCGQRSGILYCHYIRDIKYSNEFGKKFKSFFLNLEKIGRFGTFNLKARTKNSGSIRPTASRATQQPLQSPFSWKRIFPASQWDDKPYRFAPVCA
jgi:hypothetical protein